MKNSPIGVYDSGLGGLSVWREIRNLLPEESLLYLGDGENCPYGNRSNEEIREFADRAVERLLDEGCKLIVVACNTATAAAIDFLREKYRGVPIVGMEPAIKPACLNTVSGVVGVLATSRSLDGELFRHTRSLYGRDVEVIALEGRGFVEIVEENREQSPEARVRVEEVLSQMIERGADQIVLGCTHYPFLKSVIEDVIGDRAITLIDPSPAIARRVRSLIDEYDIGAERGHKAEYDFITFSNEEYRAKLRAKALTI
ncbi:MAG: glutamate racemase [Alistipes sp.]|nr:glutamate racemase [Alistipes sp.]